MGTDWSQYPTGHLTSRYSHCGSCWVKLVNISSTVQPDIIRFNEIICIKYF